jgi:hypothetical protein
MEHDRNIESLVKDTDAEIIVSDEQSDENGKTVREPVLVFASGGKRMGYISISQLQKWINYVC